MGMAEDARFFNSLLAKKNVKLDVTISQCDSIDHERHLGKKSNFAHVEKPNLICCASDMWNQSESRRRGLIGHELGHLLLIQKGDFDHTEHEADLEVKKVLGLTIKYDRHGIQKL